MLSETSLRRLTGLAALIAVPLYVLAFVLQGNPPSDHTDGSQVLAYATDHRGGILAAVYLAGLVLALALCVQAGLAQILRRAEGGDDLLAGLGLIGGVAWVSVVLAGLGFALALAYRAPAGDPPLARSLLDLALLSFTLSGFPTALNVGAFSFLMLRTRLFPRWVAWLGFLTGGAHLVAGASFAHDGLFTPLVMANLIAPALYIFWVVATGIVLLHTAAGAATRRTPRIGTTPAQG